MSLLFLLGTNAKSANSSEPPPTENFNPGKADPTGNITCQGPLPVWDFPSFDGWDPNLFTLQELCAKPQYGGRGPGQHLGGFCLPLNNVASPQLGPGIVGFDDSERAQISAQLNNPRIIYYCRCRCFCNHQLSVEERTAQPSQVPDYYRSVPRRHDDTYMIKIDIPDDYAGPQAAHRGRSDEMVFATRLNRKAQVDVHTGFFDRQDTVSIDSANHITCEGSLPSFPLPLPYTVNDFSGLQDLCAAQLTRGNPAANAGLNGLGPTTHSAERSAARRLLRSGSASVLPHAVAIRGIRLEAIGAASAIGATKSAANQHRSPPTLWELLRLECRVSRKRIA
ncbi:MAG: hypothetical protein M1817_004749 [Caeruleum heppii]|nr:MAG: hypothetical protein M1817_004749 [Caeruleum heppii]